MTITAFDTALTAAPFELIRNDVLPQVPTAVPDVVDVVIRQVLRDFFRDSTIWRVEQKDLMVRAGRQEVPLLPTASSEPGLVLNVWHKGDELRPLANAVDLTDTLAKPTHFSTPAPDVIHLWPTPKTTERVLRVYLSLLPERTYYSLPKFVATHWHNEIVSGVLGNLYLQPVKPYTDEAKALIHLRRFKDGIRAARRYAESGGQRHAPTWTYPRGGFI